MRKPYLTMGTRHCVRKALQAMHECCALQGQSPFDVAVIHEVDVTDAGINVLSRLNGKAEALLAVLILCLPACTLSPAGNAMFVLINFCVG